jgi:hypothetical protein
MATHSTFPRFVMAAQVPPESVDLEISPPTVA